jgi:hypothetical protein
MEYGRRVDISENQTIIAKPNKPQRLKSQYLTGRKQDLSV